MPTPTNTETLDSLYTSTWQAVKKQVVDNIFTATPFYYEMTKAENVESEDGGRFLEIPLMRSKNSTIGWIGRTGTVSVADVDPLTTAIYQWYNIAGSVVRVWVDDMANSGMHKKIDLLNAKIENLRLSMIDDIEGKLFTAQAGDAPNGLPDYIVAAASGSQTGSPGGLNKATYSWWENKYAAASGSFATYGKSDMRTMFNNCSKGNDHPGLLLTTQSVFEFYEAEAEDIQVINDSDAAKLGFRTFAYKGANLYYSPSCPTGYMYFLNLKYLKFKKDSKADFDMTEFKTIPNQLDRVAQVVCRANLVCSNCSMQGLLGSLTTA
jgi:hypothetical protein